MSNDLFEAGDDDFIEDEHIEVRSFIAGAIDDVWQHWVDAELLAIWWWPMFDDTRYEIDAQVGGVYRIHTVTGGIAVSGEFTEVVDGKRLEFSWHWSGESGESSVSVAFAEGDGGTVVTVTQTGIAYDEVDPLTEGWEDVLTRLEERFDELNA